MQHKRRQLVAQQFEHTKDFPESNMCNKFIKSFVEIVECNAINMLQFGLMSESKENNNNKYNDSNNNTTKDTKSSEEEENPPTESNKLNGEKITHSLTHTHPTHWTSSKIFNWRIYMSVNWSVFFVVLLLQSHFFGCFSILVSLLLIVSRFFRSSQHIQSGKWLYAYKWAMHLVHFRIVNEIVFLFNTQCACADARASAWNTSIGFPYTHEQQGQKGKEREKSSHCTCG